MDKTTDTPVEITKKHGRPIYAANPSIHHQTALPDAGKGDWEMNKKV
jgi:hypothetical protein